MGNRENLIVAGGVFLGSILGGCGPVPTGETLQTPSETDTLYDSRGPLKGIVPEEGLLPDNQGLYGPLDADSEPVGQFPTEGELVNFPEGGILNLLEEGGIIYPAGANQGVEGGYPDGFPEGGLLDPFGEGGLLGRMKEGGLLYPAEEGQDAPTPQPISREPTPPSPSGESTPYDPSGGRSTDTHCFSLCAEKASQEPLVPNDTCPALGDEFFCEGKDEHPLTGGWIPVKDSYHPDPQQRAPGPCHGERDTTVR